MLHEDDRNLLEKIDCKLDNLYDLLWSHKVDAERKFATKVEVRWALGLIVTTAIVAFIGIV